MPELLQSMRPRTQKQPQVKQEPCRELDDVDVEVLDVDGESSLKGTAPWSTLGCPCTLGEGPSQSGFLWKP